MKIDYRRNNATLSGISPGVVFYYEGEYYLRITTLECKSGKEATAVKLRTGAAFGLPGNERVEVIEDAALVREGRCYSSRE